MNIAQHLLDVLDSDSQQIALVEIGGGRFSRGQLRDRVLLRARALADAGVKPGERVVVQAFPGVELIVSAVAVLVAGGVLVIADPNVSQTLFDQRMENVEPAWFVVDRRLGWMQRFPGVRPLLQLFGIALPASVSPRLAQRLTTPCARERKFSPAFEAVPRADEEDAVIVYTGGTLHAPRAVRHSHRSTRSYLDAIRELIAPYRLGCYCADHVQQALYGLYLGIEVWTSLKEGERRIDAIARCLFEGHADMFFGPPFVWQEILRLARSSRTAAPPNLRLAILGSAPVTDKLLGQLQQWLPDAAEVLVLYGLTETGPVCVCKAEKRFSSGLRGNLVGRPLGGIELSIANPGADGIGELEIRGASVFSGYLDQGPSGGVVKTGDLASLSVIDGEQNVLLMGRTKDMIIRRGINIYPFEIEPILRGICDRSGEALWTDCALVGVWDASREDEVLVLFHVPRKRHSRSENYLKDRLGEQLGSELLPDALIEIDRLPTAGRNLEVDKAGLRALAAKRLGLDAEPDGSAKPEPAAGRKISA